MSELNCDWQVSDDKARISRTINTKNFAQAMLVAHIAAQLAEEENHHPEICLGWGYCQISFTTHSVKGLTALDFRCAKKLDPLLPSLSEAH